MREPGVALAERPELRTPSTAARVIAEYIGEADRKQFVVALFTIRHRLIGLHTAAIGCLTSSLVHPRECFKPAILAGVDARRREGTHGPVVLTWVEKLLADPERTSSTARTCEDPLEQAYRYLDKLLGELAPGAEKGNEPRADARDSRRR